MYSSIVFFNNYKWLNLHGDNPAKLDNANVVYLISQISLSCRHICIVEMYVTAKEGKV